MGHGGRGAAASNRCTSQPVLPPGQLPGTVLHMAFTSDWNFSRLIRRMFQEVTERFFLGGLDRLSEKKSDLWSDRRFSDTDTSGMSVESSAVTSPVKNMTALVSWLVDDVGKALLREQGAEFLDIRVGLYIKVEVEVPDDNSLVPLCESFV